MAFKKGQSGNPNGRPKKAQTLTTILEKIGNETHTPSGLKNKEVLAHKLWNMALGGDIKAITYLYDRIDGKPVQPSEIDMNAKVDIPLVSIKTNPPKRKNG